MTSIFFRLFPRVSRFSSGRELSDLRTFGLSDSDKRKAVGGFTLIELLIVIAIIGVLVGLLAGGIKASVESAKKRNRSTEVRALETAVMTYWHDTGKLPVTLKKDTYKASYSDDNNEVFAKLIDPSKNELGKAYLDINQLRTAKDGRVRRLERPSEPLADYKGAYYKVTIDLKKKTVTVE